MATKTDNVPEAHPLVQGNQMYYPPQGYPPGPPQSVPFPPGPVMAQPMMGQGGMQQGNWMSAPQGVPNCPPGLEYLSMIDQLIVQQKIELLEVVTGFESKNKYIVANNMGQKIYFAGEESDCCTRNCLGSIRPFDMKIVDNFGNEVIHLYRPLACQLCCFPCCLQSIEITSPPGTVIGTVEQNWTFITPSFVVKNSAGDVILRIEGPCCTCRCCADVNFKILSADGNTEVGTISKHWTGIVKEMYSDADNFGIRFPMDLDVKVKATLLGALFLIDMMYFEDNN